MNTHNTSDRRQLIAERWVSSIHNTGLSIVEVVRRAGVKESAVKNVIYAKVSNPKRELAENVGRVLNVNPAYLLLLSDDAVPAAKTYQLDKPFDYELHTDIVVALSEACKERNIMLTAEQAEALPKKIYYYHRKDDEKTIDRKFIAFILDQLA